MNGFVEAVVLDNLDCQQWVLIHPLFLLILTTFQLGFGYGSDSSAFLSEVAVPVCVQEHERYYPTPPHPSPPVTDDERAVPVSAGQQERWWVFVSVCVQEHERYYPTPPHPSSNWWWKSSACCRACVCTRTWTLSPHPTPPSGSYLACGGKQNQSLVAVRTFKNLTAASDWFWRVLQESYCRKWLILTAASDWNLTAASDGWASRTIPKIDIKLPKTDKHGKLSYLYIFISQAISSMNFWLPKYPQIKRQKPRPGWSWRRGHAKERSERGERSALASSFTKFHHVFVHITWL